jgi:MFS family permease
MPRTATAPRVATQAWIVWGAGVLAYTVAVLERTSLGVVGTEAAQRFGTGAAVVATFAVVQLLVYALLQVPVGVLLDRFGSKRMLLTGAALMVAGQLVLAVATDVQAALAARVLVGTGDAMTFVSVLRLVPAWFPSRRVPVMTQVTGIVGQLGQVASAVPLVAVLRGPGWTPAFVGAAAIGVVAAVLVLAVLRDAPPGMQAPRRARSVREVGAEVAQVLREPGTRLGLWTHFTVQYAGMVFALLWGYPFLTDGQGVAPGRAAGLLTLMVVAGMVAGPVLGRLTARHPLHRSSLVLGVVVLTVAAWTLVIAWPGRAPFAVLVGLALVLALNGPTAMVAFDFARTFNPQDRLGSATGIVNVGGFFASLVTILAIGVVLDVVTPAGQVYGVGQFKVAFCVQYVLWGVGLLGIVRSRRSTRRQMAAEGTTVLPLHRAWRQARRRASQTAVSAA